MTITGTQWNKLDRNTRKIILQATGHFADLEGIENYEWTHMGSNTRALIQKTCKGLKCDF